MFPDFRTRPPLEPFQVVCTRDPEELRRALFATYCGARGFEVLDRETEFAARGHDCALKHSGISYCHYAAPVRLAFDETTFVRQQFCMTGSGQTRLGRIHLNGTPESSCTIPADMASQIDFGADYRQLVLRFSTEALTRKLVSLVGSRPGRALTFEPFADDGSAGNQRLQRTVAFILGELEPFDPESFHPWLDELEQLMMLNFLFTARHNHRHLLERKLPDAAPWQVRRVEEFIMANLDKALTIEAIAEATEVGVRTLFKSFRTSRGYSPMAFARMQRLERARAALQSPDATTTVTGAALRWGFHNQGHFARDYRARFGELPSETLRRGK